MDNLNSIYDILVKIKEGKEITKEERENLIKKEYITYDEDSKKVNFEGIKMSYIITKKGKDFLDEYETLSL